MPLASTRSSYRNTKEGRQCVLKCQEGFHVCSGSAHPIGAAVILSSCKQELQMCALNCPDAFRNPEGEIYAPDCERMLCAHGPSGAELDAAGSTAKLGLAGAVAVATAVKAMRQLSDDAAHPSP